MMPSNKRDIRSRGGYGTVAARNWRARFGAGLAALLLAIAPQGNATLIPTPIFFVGTPIGEWEVLIFWNPIPIYPDLYPNNSNQTAYSVTIPGGNLSLVSSVTITNLVVLDGALEVNPPGSLISETTVLNGGVIRLNAGGSMITPAFDNAGPFSRLELNAGGFITSALTLNNDGEISVKAGAITTATLTNNLADTGAEINVEVGILTLVTGLVQNEGEINLNDFGTGLAAPAGLVLNGNGTLNMGFADASVSAITTLSNLGQHLIRGNGAILAAAIVNEGSIVADVPVDDDERLTVIAATLDNDGTMSAQGGARMNVEIGTVADNDGLIEANDGARLDFEALQLENTDRILANVLARIDLDVDQLSNDSGRIEALDRSVINFHDVELSDGLLRADATSVNRLFGSDHLRGDMVIEGLLEAQDGSFTTLLGHFDNRLGEIRLLEGASAELQYTTEIIGGVLGGPGQFRNVSHGTLLDATTGMHWDGTVISHDLGNIVLRGAIRNDSVFRINDQNPAEQLIGGGHLNSYVQIEGAVTFDGVGATLFASSYSNSIDPAATTPDAVLTLGSGQSLGIEDPGERGTVSVNLVNHGSIDAHRGEITLRAAELRNDALIQATASGHLVIGVDNGPMLIDHHDGLFRVDATSVVTLSGGSIEVQSGRFEGEGLFDLYRHVLFDATDGMTLSDAYLHINTGADLELRGTVTNAAHLRLRDGDPVEVALGGGHLNALLNIDGLVTIGGEGDIFFSSPHTNVIQGAPSAPVDLLIVQDEQRISTENNGNQGRITVDLENHGSVLARGGTIALQNAMTVNDGEVGAEVGGRFAIGIGNGASILDNRMGVVRAGAGSTVDLVGAALTIQGGTLVGPGLVDVNGPTLLDADTGMAWDGAQLRVNSAVDLRLRGSYANDGVLRLNDTNPAQEYFGGAHLNSRVGIDGTVAFGGTGSVLFSTGYDNSIDRAAGAIDGTLVLGPGQRLATEHTGDRGTVTVDLVSHGVIDAAGGNLALALSSALNDGAWQATTGGRLALGISNGTMTIDNHGGTIRADVGGLVSFDGANTVVLGGEVGGPGTVEVNGKARFVGNDALELDAEQLHVHGSLVLAGSFVNDGKIFIADGNPLSLPGTDSIVHVEGMVQLGGNGSILFATPNQNRIDALGAGPVRLTLGAEQSITTEMPGDQGSIGVDLEIHGSIAAIGGSIALSGTSLVNRGVVSAAAGGSLGVGGTGATVDNIGGVIEAGTGGTVAIGAAQILGGTLRGLGYFVSSTYLLDGRTDPVHLDGTLLQFLRFTRPALAGTIINDGRILLSDDNPNWRSGDATDMYLHGPVLLDGSGTLEATTPYQNSINAAIAGTSLIVGPMQTVTVPTGAGLAINVPMVVLGTLGVDGGSLAGPSSLVNDGVIRASHGSTFSRSDPISGAGGWRADGGTLQFVNNVVSTEGAIDVVNGGALLLANATLTGSSLHSDADSRISVNSVLELSGSLRFETTQESAYAWGTNATLRLTGGQGADLGAWDGWESLEIGGVDLGIDPDAYVGAEAGFGNNFDLTRLEIGAGARVFLADLFDNGNRGGPFGEAEALYVDTLVFLDPTALLNLNGLHLYFKTLIGSSDQLRNLDVKPVPIPSSLMLAGPLLVWLCIRRRPAIADPVTPLALARKR